MRIGIMQGRLSPPQGDQLQFFPEDWKAEFAIARELGFEALEWIFLNSSNNPILGWSGRRQALEQAREEGVAIESICADVFLIEHLTARSVAAQYTLVSLMKVAELMGVHLIGVPLLEGNLPQTASELGAVKENIRKALRLANGGVELALEIDLPADSILTLLEMIDSPRVGVCYDTGNAMTHGFDAGADIRRLGPHLKEIHLKDRLIGTTQSVRLGKGSVNFPDVFAALKEVNFDGLSVLQAWRGEDYLGNAKRQLEFIKNFLK